MLRRHLGLPFKNCDGTLPILSNGKNSFVRFTPLPQTAVSETQSSPNSFIEKLEKEGTDFNNTRQEAEEKLQQEKKIRLLMNIILIAKINSRNQIIQQQKEEKENKKKPSLLDCIIGAKENSIPQPKLEVDFKILVGCSNLSNILDFLENVLKNNDINNVHTFMHFFLQELLKDCHKELCMEIVLLIKNRALKNGHENFTDFEFQTTHLNQAIEALQICNRPKKDDEYCFVERNSY